MHVRQDLMDAKGLKWPSNWDEFRQTARAIQKPPELYGFGYTLFEQPHAVRSIRAQQRWDPEELARVFPKTLGANLKPPPPAAGFGATMDQRPSSEWTTADGYRYWQSPFEVSAD